MSLSIVVPTRGRASLYATLDSIAGAGFETGDEVIVVGDGKQEDARKIAGMFTNLRVFYAETERQFQDYGHSPSNLGYHLAGCDHILRIDDDDTYIKGAFAKVRAAVTKHPNRVLIFKMVALARRLAFEVLWREPVLGLGNVGSPMFVVPNDKRRLGDWGREYTGDFDFISSTVRRWGGEEKIVWMDEVIVEIR